VLVQPLPSLTDLALGLVTLFLMRRLPSRDPVYRHWRAAFAWAGATALAGAVHHGVFIGMPRVNPVSWAVTSMMVVIVVSYLLAASVVEVVGRGRALVFWSLRSLGVVAYGIVAVTGHAGITSILWCESLTMSAVVGLWIRARLRHHPIAGPMLVAVGVSIGAALFRLIPGAAALLSLDPNSAYHLGQIVGMVLLFRAVTAGRVASDLQQHRERTVVDELQLHRGAEHPRGDAGPQRPQVPDHRVDQALGDRSGGGRHPTRSPALAGVPIERELTDDQQRRIHVRAGQLAVEDPQPPQLRGHPFGHRRRIGVRDADQHGQAR